MEHMDSQRPIALRTAYQARPGKRAIVILDLADLRGPTTSVVELPLWLFWSPPGQAFDLSSPDMRRWLYQIVLREARGPEDLTNYLDGDTLVELWPQLHLPKGVRQAWEEQHPALRTQDVDVFTDELGGVEAAAEAVEAALRAAGFDTVRHDKTAGLADIFEGMGEGLAEWAVSAPGGEQTTLQLAYFDRARKPVTMDVGPVLDLEDVVGGKACALASRVEPRDYVDISAALRHYTIDQVIGFARRLDPGLGDRDFADAGRQLDRWADEVFAPYGLDGTAVAELREQLADWPRT
jgi:hypothetical protein